jgi:hypothetical protein
LAKRLRSITTTLAADFNAGKPLMLLSQTTPRDSGYVSNHFDMIVAYNATSQLFEIVNPHNSNDIFNGEIVTVRVNWNTIGRDFVDYAVGSVR